MARASESTIQDIGRDILRRAAGQTPSLFRKDWWSGKMMEWSMKDEAFKVEMFRFVDVFPALGDHIDVAEHLQSYFCRPEQDFPSSFQWGLSKVKPDSRLAKMAAGQIEKQISGMAERFIAGHDAVEALPTLRGMWDEGVAFTLDLLGESTVSEKEARGYVERYHEILDTLQADAQSWPKRPQLQESALGPIPRINLSVKISSLYSQIDPLDFAGSIEVLRERLRPLFIKAKRYGAFINLDMEHSAYKALTLALFRQLLSEPGLIDYPHFGIVIQAYLRDAYRDLEELAKWAKKRGTPVTVRLVKGAYWDYETIYAAQNGWPSPVFLYKWETDANFERCAQYLIDQIKHVRPAIGSHNVRSIASAMAYAQGRKVEPSAVEFQMLYGMAEPLKAAVTGRGYRLRDYVPIGEMIPGMAYLVRRLLENTSNESWLRASFAEGISVDELLADPESRRKEAERCGETTEAVDKARLGSTCRTGQGSVSEWSRASGSTQTASGDAEANSTAFANQPMLDFREESVRHDFASALGRVRGQFGGAVKPCIAGQTVETDDTRRSVNPARPSECVGTIGLATLEDADRAVQAAKKAASDWAARPVQERAECLFKAADAMAERRLELAAWMVFEVGKGWHEADADVCEAIDFCRYYAEQMLRLGQPRRLGRIPGEHNVMFYQPRGVAAVIAPWNFPLAILCGMTCAALVTGNAVVMKPAEQSSVMASKLAELLYHSGIPNEILHFVPGRGETVGEHLVKHADVDVIAFTGSMDVGLQILRVAGNTSASQTQVKKVVCEMGGKNAIVVDADADLDEAVLGVVKSAFGYQGQKCSACSRVIVVEGAYEAFRERLVEAVKSLKIGPPENPGSKVGPVIDAEAQAKIRHYMTIGAQEGTQLVRREVPEEGFYVGPAVFEGIAPGARLAQEEIFGPVLALMRASTFQEALRIANGTQFALTGGVYSRKPDHIELARKTFNVGNLYINRNITGALVYRQPFGGFKMSGVGSKAGGPDYLFQFMVPRVVSENTMRRGFAPEVE